MINTTYGSHKEILSEANKRGLVDYTVYEVENLRRDFECTFEARARFNSSLVGTARHTAKFDAFSTAEKQLAYNLAEKKAIEKAIEQVCPGISIVDQPKPDSYRVQWAKRQMSEGNCTYKELQEVVIKITGELKGQKLDDMTGYDWSILELVIKYGFNKSDTGNSWSRWLAEQCLTEPIEVIKAIKDAQLIFVGEKFIVNYSAVSEAQWGLIKAMVEKSLADSKPKYSSLFRQETQEERVAWLGAETAKGGLTIQQIDVAWSKVPNVMRLSELTKKDWESFKYWIEKAVRENEKRFDNTGNGSAPRRKNTKPDESLDDWIVQMGARGAKDKDFWSAASAASGNKTLDLRQLSENELTQAKEYLEKLLTRRNVFKSGPFTKIKDYGTSETTSRFRWVLNSKLESTLETPSIQW
jgi:hypothetical protein